MKEVSSRKERNQVKMFHSETFGCQSFKRKRIIYVFLQGKKFCCIYIMQTFKNQTVCIEENKKKHFQSELTFIALPGPPGLAPTL